MPSIKHRSINDKNDIRVKMAEYQKEKFEKQSEDKKKNKQYIADLVNEFLEKIGITVNHDQKFENIIPVKSKEENVKGRISYSEIQKNSGITRKEDIVWIKFNNSGCISVIGVGCDIYFTEKAKNETSAGKINQYLGEVWDDKEVLIFPLINLDKTGFNRSDIESGIGNYLISKGVPILDYYSHNY